MPGNWADLNIGRSGLQCMSYAQSMENLPISTNGQFHGWGVTYICRVICRVNFDDKCTRFYCIFQAYICLCILQRFHFNLFVDRNFSKNLSCNCHTDLWNSSKVNFEVSSKSSASIKLSLCFENWLEKLNYALSFHINLYQSSANAFFSVSALYFKNLSKRDTFFKCLYS